MACNKTTVCNNALHGKGGALPLHNPRTTITNRHFLRKSSALYVLGIISCPLGSQWTRGNTLGVGKLKAGQATRAPPPVRPAVKRGRSTSAA